MLHELALVTWSASDVSEENDYETMAIVGGAVAVAIAASIFGVVKLDVFGAAEPQIAAATAPAKIQKADSRPRPDRRMQRAARNPKPIRARELKPGDVPGLPGPKPLAPPVDLEPAGKGTAEAPSPAPKPTVLAPKPAPEPPQPRPVAPPKPAAPPPAAAPAPAPKPPAPIAPAPKPAAPPPAAPKPPTAAPPVAPAPPTVAPKPAPAAPPVVPAPKPAPPPAPAAPPPPAQ